MNKIAPSKFLVFLVTFAIICISFVSTGSAAWASETINLNELAPFKNRTLEEVATRYYKILKPSYYYAGKSNKDYYLVQPSVKYPYSGGQLKHDAHQAITDMRNYYRWVMGVSYSNEVSEHDPALQKASVIEYLYFQENHNLTHHLYENFTKPADMSDDFWNIGAHTPNVIVAGGFRPQGSIEGFFHEGYDTSSKQFDTIGHRFVLLSKTTVNKLNFGFANLITMANFGGSTGGSGTTDLPIVAFPAPGFFPQTAATANNTAWSFEFGTYNIKNLNDVSVKVTNLRTNENYTASNANGNLIAQYNGIVYAQPKIERPYYYKDSYRITINGLYDPEGNPKTVEYTTHFSDLSRYANSFSTNINTVSLSEINGIVIQPSYPQTGSMVPYEAVKQILPGLSLRTDTQYKQDLSVTWKIKTSGEKQVTYQVDRYNQNLLHKNVSDSDHLIDQFEVTPEFNSSEVPKVGPIINASEGKAATISLQALWKTDGQEPSYNWYRLLDDGTVQKLENHNHELRFSKVSLADAGKYFATYINKKQLYVTGIKKLSVHPKTVSSIIVNGFSNTDYYQGDKLNLGNAKIGITYSDDTTGEVPLSLNQITGYNPNNVGAQTLTVTYGGKKTNVVINVKEKTLTKVSIAQQMRKTQYTQGEDLDLTGMTLQANYVNNTNEIIPVTESMISGYNKDKVGVQDITITYKNHTVTVAVEVTANPARALELAKNRAQQDIRNMSKLNGKEKEEAIKEITSANTTEEINKIVAKYQKTNDTRQALQDSKDRATNIINNLKYLQDWEKYFAISGIESAKTIETVEKNLEQALKANKQTGK